MDVRSIASEDNAALPVVLRESRFVGKACEPNRIARAKICPCDACRGGREFNERYWLGGRHGSVHDDPVMYAVAPGRHKQGTSFVHHRDQRLYGRRIEHSLYQHESVLCWMADEIDADVPSLPFP